MKSLSQHISEKLIINRNYKNVDDIKSMFDNVEFEHCEDEELGTSDDIFSMMVYYIRGNNIRSFSDFDSYKKTSLEDRDACLVAFNKRTKDMNIFQKMPDMPDGTYIDFTIFKRSLSELYHFERYELYLESVDALQNNKKWNNVDEVEYYEISKETFGDISKLYDELIEK